MAESHDHDGHRQRMRKKYLTHGLDIFEDHEILEIMLYYAVPRKDTNPIAHKLLNRFGSLSAVFDAPVDLLCEAGLSENAAVLVKLIPDLLSVYMCDKYNPNKKTLSDQDIPKMLINKFLGKDSEMVCLILMDSKFKELYFGIISKGSITNADLNIPMICNLALRYHARYVIVAHNHPSGVCLPSKADLKVTTKLYIALSHLNIKLLDHYIVADDDCISLSQSNVFYKSEKELQNNLVADIDYLTEKYESGESNPDDFDVEEFVADRLDENDFYAALYDTEQFDINNDEF